MKTFRANGKLLLSGEYAVLDGALALAIPCKYGQILTVSASQIISMQPKLKWKAYLSDQRLWFSAEIDLRKMTIEQTTDESLAKSLLDILKVIHAIKPEFFNGIYQDTQATTRLAFPKDWGLGSSSTLIHLLSQWSGVDAYELNQKTFNTSGYDVACAGVKTPILYQNKKEERLIQEVEFNPPFADSIYFVHLNQKQDTQLHVGKHYRDLERDLDWLYGVSAMSYNMLQAQTLEEFETLMSLHEELIVFKLGLEKAKDLYFPDYEGAVKSLGAWGGDFVMVTARGDFKNYFNSKGYHTIFSLKEMII